MTTLGVVGTAGLDRASATQADSATWSQYRGGPSHSGATAATHPDQLETSRWAVGNESSPASFPAVVDGTVFVGVGTAVLAVDNAAGTGLWQTAVESQIVHSPAVGEDNVFVTLDDGDLLALSRADGSEQWRIGLGGRPSAPTVADGTVYVGTTNDRIAAFDAASGSVVWSDNRTLDETASVTMRPTPAYADGTVYVNVNETDSGLVALDAATGEEQWAHWFDDAEEALIPAVGDGRVALTTGHPDTSVTVFSTAGGIVQWEQQLANIGTRFPAAIDDGLLAIAIEPWFGETSLLAYDLDVGEQRWSYERSEQAPGGVTIGSDAVYLTAFSSDESVVAAIGRKNGFEQATQAIDYPTESGYGPVPTTDTLLVPNGHGLQALGGGSSSDGEPVPTDDSGPTVRQQSTDTVERTNRETVVDGDTGSGGGGVNVFSLEVAGTVATILAAIGTILQVLQGN